MPVTMLTKALMGSAAPVEPTAPVEPAGAPAPPQGARKVTAIDLARFIHEGVSSTSTGTPRMPVQKVRHGGSAPGMTPRIPVTVKTTGGKYANDDEALGAFAKMIDIGEVAPPIGYSGATQGDPQKQIDFLRRIAEPELNKIRKSTSVVRAQQGGVTTPAVPSGQTGQGVVKQGSARTTQHVVPRTTFTVNPSINVQQFATGLPSVIEHVDAFTSGNKGIKSVGSWLSNYATYQGTDAGHGDATLKQIADAYMSNKGNQAAQDALTEVAKAYTGFLRSSKTALQNGWSAADLGTAYKQWANKANTLLGAIQTKDTTSLKAQTRSFGESQQLGILGAIRTDKTKSEWDDLSGQTDDAEAIKFHADRPQVKADTNADMVDAIKRAGVTVAKNQLMSQFTGQGNVPGSSQASRSYTAKANLIEALAFHPQSPLNRILTEQVTNAVDGLRTSNPKMLAELAGVLRARSGGGAGKGEAANTFDANVAKRLKVPEMLMTNVGLLFSGRQGNATDEANFDRAANLAVKELQRGAKTNWNRVTQLLQPYVSQKDFDMMFPRSNVQRTMNVPDGLDEQGNVQTKPKTDVYVPTVASTKLHMAAFKDMTGIDLGTTNTGGTNIPNYGKRAFNVLQEVQDTDPELYKYLVERTMKAAPGGRMDVGDVKGKGRTLKSTTGVAPAEGPVRPGDAAPTATTGRTTFATDLNRPLDINLANAIWHSVLNPQRPHDYEPGKPHSGLGAKNPNPGELLARISDTSKTFADVLKHPVTPVNVEDSVTRGQEQQRINAATVKKTDAPAMTTASISQLSEYYDHFRGLHPTDLTGIVAKKDGNEAQRRLYEIQQNPKELAMWKAYGELEQQAITSLGKQHVEGGAHGQTVVGTQGRGKTTRAIGNEINRVADELIGSSIKDPDEYRRVKGGLINYLSSLSDKARSSSGMDLGLLDKFQNMFDRYKGNMSVFEDFNPVGRVGDTKLPDNITWAEATKMASAIEALVRKHGSKFQKELLTLGTDDARGAGHKVLRELSSNPARVFSIVDDLREQAGMPATSRPAAPRSNISRPTEDAALRKGTRSPSEQLAHELTRGAKASAGVDEPAAIGDKGPTGKGYQKPGAPVRDQIVWQPFMSRNGPNSVRNAYQWYQDFVQMIGDNFAPGTPLRQLGFNIARKLTTGESIDRIISGNADDPNLDKVLKTAKREGFPVEARAARRGGLVRAVTKGGKVLGVGGLATSAALQGEQGIRGQRK